MEIYIFYFEFVNFLKVRKTLCVILSSGIMHMKISCQITEKIKLKLNKINQIT